MSNIQLSINQLHESKPRWFAVYTAFRKEKFAKQMLEKKGVKTYLPLQKSVKRYNSRVKKIEVPLINCYIFVNIVKKEYVKVLETDSIIKFIKIGKDLVAIPDSEIEILKRILGENIEINISQSEFVHGDKVEITQGNLMGLTGKLVDFYGKNKVIVELSTIGFSVQMEINKDLLAKG